MVGLTRRKRVEGWAIDVAETNEQIGRNTIWQRVADNDKLWIVCLLGILVLALALARLTGGGSEAEDRIHLAANRVRGTYDDQAHTQLAAEFAAKRYGHLQVQEAEFVALDKFRIVVPANMGRDDVEYLAKLAGLKIYARFHYRPVILAYMRGANGIEKLAATAQWDRKRYGFSIKQYGVKIR